MADLSPTDAYLLEKVCDPNSLEFVELYDKLMEPADDGRSRAERLRSAGDWRYVLPFRGEPSEEIEVKEIAPVEFAERGSFRNGAYSLSLVIADLIDLIELYSKRSRLTKALVVSAEVTTIVNAVGSTGSVSSMVFYCAPQDIRQACLEVQPEVLLVDHTSVNFPIDELLSFSYKMGIHIVDGVFPYHIAAIKGWDVTTHVGKWSYTHQGRNLVVGPDDDCSRLVKYTKANYEKFVKPLSWNKLAKNYGYEIRRCKYGLATYRAVYLETGAESFPIESFETNMPLCSSDDMILITVNRELAAGVFASYSNNAMDVAAANMDYAIEVRRELYYSCTDFLISSSKGADIVGQSVRYIAEHNYVDLVEGIRVVRIPSLQYADALCVSMVCALTAFSLRYRLTNESIPDVTRTIDAAKMRVDAPFGALGRIAWWFSNYLKDAVSKVSERAISRAKQLLYNTDFIPGVCYNLYATNSYTPNMNWFEANQLQLDYDFKHPHKDVVDFADDGDAFTAYLGDSAKTAAPTVKQVSEATVTDITDSRQPYVPNIVEDPINNLQDFYDHALPGNSTAQLQNVAEYRRVKDVNLNTEFYGRVEINKDVAAPERLHDDMPLRTASIPPSPTPLIDAIMASAKRNFNPPDLQVMSDPWSFAKLLVDKFVDWAFIPGFRDTIGKAYIADPLTFNVEDYLEWRATRDGAYRSALEAECPEDIVELGLEKYDTIVKKRVKPKLSTAAQHELAQPQVIVSLSKKNTALFTSVFRKIFERFDHALRPEICSAGRLSDSDISKWLTKLSYALTKLKSIEMDSSKYDKSQGILARMVEAYMMQALGLDPQVSEIFSDSYVGKVSSKTLGLYFTSSYQMKSGAPQTMLGNIIYNAVSAMECVGSSNILYMMVKGDDNLIWVTPRADVRLAIEKMSGLFNLETKLIVGNVPYFSSGYILYFSDRALFVPDLLKLVELAGERSFDRKVILERFVSFQDRVRSFLVDDEIPRALQSSMRVRLDNPTLDVVTAVDSLAAVAKNYSLYESIVAP